MNNKFRKVLKIVFIGFSLIFIGLIGAFYWFSKPKSSNEILEEFKKDSKFISISYLKFNNFEYRVLSSQEEIDSLKKTLVFVHGSIGSAMDFKKYFMDTDLNEKFNIVAYDRIGYGINNAGNVQASIEFERSMLDDFIIQQNIKSPVLVGYSFGGPIVLTSKTKCDSKILLAPALFSEEEKVPALIKLYEWKITRWLMPAVWKSASKEKLTHANDLHKFEGLYVKNTSKIISIHGKDDWIVPYKNSLILRDLLPSKQFELVTLNKTGHELVWTKFNKIKEVLLQL